MSLPEWPEFFLATFDVNKVDIRSGRPTLSGSQFQFSESPDELESDKSHSITIMEELLFGINPIFMFKMLNRYSLFYEGSFK